MAEETKHKVIINLYDLSGGLAKVFSPMFLGKQIEGVWHTGIHIYGQEYYYGGGICVGQNQQTPYGKPIREIPVGETEIPKEVFEDFLNDIKDKYTMDKYDLLTNNCNNFTDECCHFLTGDKIPEFITGLPKDVMDTPIGKMLQPAIQQMQNNVIQQSGQTGMFPQQFEGVQNNQQMFNQQPQQQTQQASGNNQDAQQQLFQQIQNANLLGNLDINNLVQQTQNQQQEVDMKKVIEIQDFMDYIEKTSSSEAYVVDFYSKQCGPCKQIKPIYADLSEQYPDIQFYMVDGQKYPDISGQFQIKGFPTFFSFFNQTQEDVLIGANENKLRQLVEKLDKKVKDKKKPQEQQQQQLQQQQ